MRSDILRIYCMRLDTVLYSWACTLTQLVSSACQAPAVHIAAQRSTGPKPDETPAPICLHKCFCQLPVEIAVHIYGVCEWDRFVCKDTCVDFQENTHRCTAICVAEPTSRSNALGFTRSSLMTFMLHFHIIFYVTSKACQIYSLNPPKYRRLKLFAFSIRL